MTRPPDGRDRDDRLLEALDAVENQAHVILDQNVEAHRQFVWAQANRIGLLWVHGVAGIGIGTLMLIFGTAYNIEATVGLWTRTALGASGVLGGAVLCWGLTRKPLRSIPAEALGLIVLALWDLAIAVAFVAVLFDSPPQPSWPWEAIPQDASRPYPVGVYAALLALLALHVYTLRGLLALRGVPRNA